MPAAGPDAERPMLKPIMCESQAHQREHSHHDLFGRGGPDVGEMAEERHDVVFLW